MIDILFAAKGRPQFTSASLATLVENTDMRKVRLVVYTDTDLLNGGVTAILERFVPNKSIYTGAVGGPVGAMLHYLSRRDTTPIFAKIDNDVIVPKGWLPATLRVMESHPELGLLGIEPPMSRTRAPWQTLDPIAPEDQYRKGAGYSAAYASCDAIGGIGLMRTSAFDRVDQMKPHSLYGGFTDWQWRHPEVKKGWMLPPLKVFLLDRLPIQPWADLSRTYIEAGEQRPWTNYPMSSKDLWGWWQA